MHPSRRPICLQGIAHHSPPPFHIDAFTCCSCPLSWLEIPFTPNYISSRSPPPPTPVKLGSSHFYMVPHDPLLKVWQTSLHSCIPNNAADSQHSHGALARPGCPRCVFRPLRTECPLSPTPHTCHQIPSSVPSAPSAV